MNFYIKYSESFYGIDEDPMMTSLGNCRNIARFERFEDAEQYLQFIKLDNISAGFPIDDIEEYDTALYLNNISSDIYCIGYEIEETNGK